METVFVRAFAPFFVTFTLTLQVPVRVARSFPADFAHLRAEPRATVNDTFEPFETFNPAHRARVLDDAVRRTFIV